MTVEAEGSGHLIVRDARGNVIAEIQAGPSADEWLADRGLTWDDVG